MIVLEPWEDPIPLTRVRCLYTQYFGYILISVCLNSNTFGFLCNTGVVFMGVVLHRSYEK